MAKNKGDRTLMMGTGSKEDLDMYFEFYFGAHRPPLMHADRGWHPPADMFETDKSIVIRVDLAGVDIQQVNVVLDKESLTMTGCRMEPEGAEKRQYHKMEVPYGPFERVFRLPVSVCADETRAEYKDGFLVIELMKRDKPVARKTTIRIR
ncbi:Hsp20/alpha crystallin family protein [bacterium]|nr:Hsp20/alpha crystallin family protein [bacterium]